MTPTISAASESDSTPASSWGSSGTALGFWAARTRRAKPGNWASPYRASCMAWRSIVPVSGRPGTFEGFGERSSSSASARNNGRTLSGCSASRSPCAARAGSAAQAAKSGKRSSAPRAMFASQPRSTRVGSGSPLLSSTRRSVRCGNLCAYTAVT